MKLVSFFYKGPNKGDKGPRKGLTLFFAGAIRGPIRGIGDSFRAKGSVRFPIILLYHGVHLATMFLNKEYDNFPR